jgi:hypothetical protein
MRIDHNTNTEDVGGDRRRSYGDGGWGTIAGVGSRHGGGGAGGRRRAGGTGHGSGSRRSCKSNLKDVYKSLLKPSSSAPWARRPLASRNVNVNANEEKEAEKSWSWSLCCNGGLHGAGRGVGGVGEGEDFVQRTEPVRTDPVPWPSSPTSPSPSSPSSSTSYGSYSHSHLYSRSLPTSCYTLLHTSSTPRPSLGVWIAFSSPSSPSSSVSPSIVPLAEEYFDNLSDSDPDQDEENNSEDDFDLSNIGGRRNVRRKDMRLGELGEVVRGRCGCLRVGVGCGVWYVLSYLFRFILV